MAKKRLTAVLMGCGGNMRGAHLPRILADGAVRIAAVADPIEAQAASLMRKAGAKLPYFDDWRAMLEAVPADGAIISTPHRDHFPQARACLERGLHVLVEKPLVIRAAHARNLLALAAKQERALVVAYQRHWMAHFVYARELIQSGALGTIRGVTGYVTQNWLGMGGWRQDPAASGGGMFMDTGSHLVAAALWLTGLRPRTVTATFDNVGREVDVNSAAIARCAGGALLTLATLGNAARHDERLAIAGSEGSLVLRLHGWGLRAMLRDDAPAEPPKRIRASTPDAAFFGWMRRGLGGYETPDFALQVARLTEAAYRAAGSGETVAVR